MRLPSKATIAGLLVLALALTTQSAWTVTVRADTSSGPGAGLPAQSCPDEETEYIERTPNSAHIYGSSNTLYLQNRTVSDCDIYQGSYGRTGSDSDVLNTSEVKFIKVGWEERLDGSGNHVWSGMKEACLTTVIPPSCAIPKTLLGSMTFHTDNVFRVYNAPIGSTTYVLCIDYGANGSCVQKGSVDYGFTYSIAQGGTFKVGGSSGAVDHHWDLKVLMSSGSFTDWYAQQENTDLEYGIAGYLYCPDSNTEYRIVTNGAGC
jgi:hypothetical protein